MKGVPIVAPRALESDQVAALAVTTALARAGDVSTAAEAVNQALFETTRLARSAVLLYGDDGVCRFVGSRGISHEYQRAVEGHCPWKEGASDAEAIVIADALGHPELGSYRPILEREGIAALAFVPVLAKTGVVGKLMLYASAEETITERMVAAAHVVAVSLGAAVTRLRMADALARSESRLRAVIETAMDAVISIDCAGTITAWNPQAEATFGWKAGEALGRPLEALIVPEDQRALHRAGLERYFGTGESRLLGKRIEVPAVRKDGTRLTVELSVTALHAGGSTEFNGFLRDITAQKRAADELIEARAAAEAANRAKSEFLANMSHEIRTPLTAILGYADLLRDDGDVQRAPAPRLRTIDTIQTAGQHLLTILNDILDISKIEAGKMTVETVETDLTRILLEIDSLCRPRAEEKGVRLAVQLASALPGRIASDPTRLRQILMNLVGNAVKFTLEGRVTVTAGVRAAQGEQRLVIDVEDTGPGLTSEQVARIFSSFAQADTSVTRRHGGSGLGLVISNRLAQLLGGSVSLERSAPGVGSCFRLDLPLRAVPGVAWVAALEGAPLRHAAARSGPLPVLAGRILLAEDGRDNQYLISFYLRKAGAEVEVAENGRAALEALARATAEGRPHALLLTDIQMPEMDGYTLVRTLRRQGSRLPIVALTAHAMPEDRERCLAAGCDDVAVKPIDRAGLLTLCAHWLTSGAAAA